MKFTRDRMRFVTTMVALWALPVGAGAAGQEDEDRRRHDYLEVFYGQPLTATQVDEIDSWDVENVDWWTDRARNDRALRKQAHLRYLSENSRFTLASVEEYEELFGIRYIGPDPLNEKSVGLLEVDGRLRPDLITLPELVEYFMRGVIGDEVLAPLEPPVAAWEIEQLARTLAQDEELIRSLPWLWRLDRYGLLSGGSQGDRLADGAETFFLAALETIYPSLYLDPEKEAQKLKEENEKFWESLTNAPEDDIRQAWTRLLNAEEASSFERSHERAMALLERLPDLHGKLFAKFLTGEVARSFSYVIPVLDHRIVLSFFESLDENLRGRHLSSADATESHRAYQNLSLTREPPLHIKKDGNITTTEQGRMTVYVNGWLPTIQHTLRGDTNIRVPPLLKVVGSAQFGATKDGSAGSWSPSYATFCNMWEDTFWTTIPVTECPLDSQRAWERLVTNQTGWYHAAVKDGSKFHVFTPEFFEESMSQAASRLGLTVESVGQAGIELRNSRGQKIHVPSAQVDMAITKKSTEHVQICDERPQPEQKSGEPEACFTCPEPMTVVGPGRCQCPEGTVVNIDDQGNLLDPVCIDICEVLPETCEAPEACSGGEGNGNTCYVDYNEIEDWPDPGWEPIPDSQVSATYGNVIIAILDRVPCTITHQLVFVDVYIPLTGTVIKVAVETEILCTRTGNKQVDCSQPEYWYLCDPNVAHVNGPPPGFACEEEGGFQCVADGTLSQPCRGGFWRQPLTCEYGCEEATGECLASPEACVDGETRCTTDGTAVQRCTGGAWSGGVLCDEGCDPELGLCGGTPVGPCSGDARRCIGNDSALQYCHEGQWGFAEECPFGCDASAPACFDSPTGQCAAGDRRCTTDGRRVQLCEAGGWGSTILCAYGCDPESTSCRATAPGCPPVYTDRCEVWGRTRCSGNNVLSCEVAPNGCLTWTLAGACTEGCSSGICNELACSGPDSCSVEGARRCPTTSTVEECGYAADGCLRWQEPAVGSTCDVEGGEICELGVCRQKVCSSSMECFLSGGACANGFCAPCDPVSNPCYNGYRCNEDTGRCTLMF